MPSPSLGLQKTTNTETPPLDGHCFWTNRSSYLVDTNPQRRSLSPLRRFWTTFWQKFSKIGRKNSRDITISASLELIYLPWHSLSCEDVYSSNHFDPVHNEDWKDGTLLCAPSIRPASRSSSSHSRWSLPTTYSPELRCEDLRYCHRRTFRWACTSGAKFISQLESEYRVFKTKSLLHQYNFKIHGSYLFVFHSWNIFKHNCGHGLLSLSTENVIEKKIYRCGRVPGPK